MSNRDEGYNKAPSGRPIALEARDINHDGRRFSPSIGRNKDAVRDAFLSVMPKSGEVLEIASGTGEHGAHIVEKAAELNWTYSDIDAESRASQRAWIAHCGHNRLRPPIDLDASVSHWGEAERTWDSLFCANMIHIAPFAVAEGLLAGAGRLLRAGGLLFLYGPFGRDGAMAPSNRRFDEDLKRRDPAWGVRDLDQDIVPIARLHGLELKQVIEMPANNLSIIWVRA